MPAPPFTLKHVKTNKQYKNRVLIYQYWFKWQKRTTHSARINLSVRIDLLDGNGTVVAIASGRIPKVRIIGYMPKTKSEPREPIYDTPQLIKIEHSAEATQFQYCLLKGINGRSDSVVGLLDGHIED